MPAPSPGATQPGGSPFVTTHWSLVLAAGHRQAPDSEAALEQLCRTYWPPLYAYVRRSGRSPEDAQDLTQGFFAHLLTDQRLGTADPDRGRFRSFLLTSLQRFLINDWKRATREKRGGGAALLSFDCDPEEALYAREPADGVTPEHLFERRWATRLLETTLAKLGEDYRAAGQAALFDALKGYVWGDAGDVSYAEIGARIGLTEGAVKVAVHRLRGRFRERLRGLVSDTVANPEDPAEIDAELRHLLEVLSRRG
jgi:RNA polymerase sigma factor (sigma-70 family)